MKKYIKTSLNPTQPPSTLEDFYCDYMVPPDNIFTTSSIAIQRLSEDFIDAYEDVDGNAVEYYYTQLKDQISFMRKRLDWLEKRVNKDVTEYFNYYTENKAV